jgi:hypothetical protein
MRSGVESKVAALSPNSFNHFNAGVRIFNMAQAAGILQPL